MWGCNNLFLLMEHMTDRVTLLQFCFFFVLVVLLSVSVSGTCFVHRSRSGSAVGVVPGYFFLVLVLMLLASLSSNLLYRLSSR